MQKNNRMFYWIIAAAVGCAMLFLCGLRTRAETVQGGEVCFLHTHGDACYGDVTKTCSGNHSFSYAEDYQEGHCPSCLTWVSLKMSSEHGTCTEAKVSWQQNGKAHCTVCGALKLTWGGPAGTHSYSVRELTCGLQEGEKTAAFYISGENNWTNSPVTLTLNANILKQDLSSDSISTSWAGNQCSVEENGTYSATITNGKGESVTASITVNCIDKIAPVINSATGDVAGMTKETIRVQVSASDEGSGLADAPFSQDGGATWGTGSSFALTEGYPVDFAVRDRAGNVTVRRFSRSDYPYPAVPAPAPEQTPSTSESQAGSGTGGGTSAKTEQSSSKTQVSENQAGGAAGKAQTSDSDVQTEGKAKNTEKKNKGDSLGSESEKSKAGNALTESSVGENLKEEVSVRENPLSQETQEELWIVRIADETQEDEETAGASGSGIAEVLDEKTPEAVTDGKAQGQWELALLNQLPLVCGILILGLAVCLFVRQIWLRSAVLYCYSGGEEYRRLGILYIRRGKREYTLFLPEEMLSEAETPRYRLILKRGLVKGREKMDLVVFSEENKLRQRMEECVDFVL